jgi:hypothetical protein
MNLSFCDIDTKFVRAKKGEAGYDSFKEIKGIKIGALTEKKGLSLSIFISPDNIHGSRIYYWEC